MKKINLSITGCLGRMGQELIKSSKKNKLFKIESITEYKLIKKKILGISPQLNSDIAFKNTDIIIDFTIPKCTLEVLSIAKKIQKKVVIGTTEFTKKQEALIKLYSKQVTILKAGNMSLGGNWIMSLTEIASKSLDEKNDTKIY